MDTANLVCMRRQRWPFNSLRTDLYIVYCQTLKSMTINYYSQKTIMSSVYYSIYEEFFLGVFFII